MNAVRHAALLAWKDLRVEARSRQAFGAILLLGILVVVVLGLGMNPGGATINASAILWVAYIFGGMLCFEKTMLAERADDAFSAIMLSPASRGSIFAGKLIANFAMLLGLAAVVTPLAITLFGLDLSRAPAAAMGVIVLGLAGFAGVGTLFSAFVSHAGGRGGLLSLLALPLNLPMVLASTRLLSNIVERGDGAGTAIPILLAFDVLFLVVGWLAFELVLEP